MEKVFVKVDYQVLTGGAIRPTRIHWHDGRTWNIDKTLHSCTSEHDFKGIRYTVLIGSAEKYLYRIDDQWYGRDVHDAEVSPVWDASQK